MAFRQNYEQLVTKKREDDAKAMMSANMNAKAQAVTQEMMNEQADEVRFLRDKISILENEKRINLVEIKRSEENI